jgi:hypothetical protein
VGIDPAEYHKAKQGTKRGDPAYVMSPSSINRFAELPSKWIRGYESPTTKAQLWGNVLETPLLTPTLFDRKFAVQPAKYQTTGMQCPNCLSVTDSKKCSVCKCERVEIAVEKEWTNQSKTCQEWVAARKAEGREVISNEMKANCDQAVKRLFEPRDGDDTIARWFAACDKQVWLTGEWHDEATGMVIPLSSLLDFVPHADSEFRSCLGDYKTAASANPFKFESKAYEFGYHRQAALSMDLWNLANTAENKGARDTWCFVVQESFEPWEPCLALFGQDGDLGDPGFVTLGRDAKWGGYEGVLAMYCQCLAKNRWPGYAAMGEQVQGWCVLRPKPWMATPRMVKVDFDEAEATDQAVEEETDDVGN